MPGSRAEPGNTTILWVRPLWTSSVRSASGQATMSAQIAARTTPVSAAAGGAKRSEIGLGITGVDGAGVGGAEATAAGVACSSVGRGSGVKWSLGIVAGTWAEPGGAGRAVDPGKDADPGKGAGRATVPGIGAGLAGAPGARPVGPLADGAAAGLGVGAA